MTIDTLDLCDSDKHGEPVIATRRVHWPTGSFDYCEECHTWALRVSAAMGISVCVESLRAKILHDQYVSVVNRLTN